LVKGDVSRVVVCEGHVLLSTTLRAVRSFALHTVCLTKPAHS
jgi:hypothetical protein